MVEHIVHIDGVTGSSPVATTPEPNRKVRLNLHIEKMDTENCPYVLEVGAGYKINIEFKLTARQFLEPDADAAGDQKVS